MKQTILALFVILAVPVSADWIQTRDGARIETRGAWKVRGSVVIFTSKSGTLSSLRLTEVDLDASAVATASANKPAPRPEPRPRPERKSVLVLTDKDVARAPSAQAPARARLAPEETGKPEDDDMQAEGADSGQALAEPVTVIRWREARPTEVDGVEIHGTLQNHAKHLVTDVRMLVHLRDREGELLGVSNAFLGALSLAPGSTTKFRALFPEAVGGSVQAEFEIRSHRIDIQPTGRTGQPEREEGNES